MLETFRNKKIIVTGHTGFKGSWLAAWLSKLGARVIGVSRDVPTEPSHFEAAHLSGLLEDHRLDVGELPALRDLVRTVQPDFVFHLAAQSLVKRSYQQPLETYQTNALGSVNVLEALRDANWPIVAIMVTSDKAYSNKEWPWGYRETDALGGSDPYSASKAMAELAIRGHLGSFFNSPDGSVRVAVARAGNVIGGGDWAADRVVPDCVRAWSRGDVVNVRDPLATRPWQHVLEPLSGYLTLAARLAGDASLHGEPFNFGPLPTQNHSVQTLIDSMAHMWGEVRWQVLSHGNGNRPEAGLLRLNCDKAHDLLKWQATMEFPEMVQMTVDWYKAFYRREKMTAITFSQIEQYTTRGKESGRPWAQ